MARCEACETVVVFLKSPEGRWLPPVEPIIDFADGDHFVATADGIAQPIPQIYRRHQCETFEQRSRRLAEKQAEKDRLIAEDRLRRAEAARVDQETREALAAARRAQEAAERELADARRKREQAARQRREERRVTKELETWRLFHHRRTAPRLLITPCRDCKAEAGEPCRNDRFETPVQKGEIADWWRSPHNSRYADAPPAPRVLPRPEYWGPDYQGPWPPAADDPGRYEMGTWLRENYGYVFDPDTRRKDGHWLTPREEITLTIWLRTFGAVLTMEEHGNERRS